MEYYKKYEERYQAVYAAGADMWGYSPDDETLNDYLTKWVNAHKLQGKSVLETCCGEGGAGVILSKLGCVYHGFDTAPSALETAKRLLSSCESASVELLDLVQEPIQGQYDAAFDAMGFHMLLTDADRAAYLKNVCQALKPGAPMLFFREAYREDAYEGKVTSCEQWIEIVGGGYDKPETKHAKKGSEMVEVMIPRMPGRYKNEAGYRKELTDAGFVIDDFQLDSGWKGAKPFACIWVHKYNLT